MPDGIWSAGVGTEILSQGKLTRHRLLTVNCGIDLTQGWNEGDASGFASANPNGIFPLPNPITDRGLEGGPHFIMSGETPDASHSYGFEFVLFLDGITAGNQAVAAAGGYTVTVWELISTVQRPGLPPPWASFKTMTGVGAYEAWHSFDCNATALRFQITNLASNPVNNNKSIHIAFVEL